MTKKQRKKPAFKNINIRMTEKEYDAIEEAAYDKGMFKAEYLREIGLKAVKRAGYL